VRALRSIDSVSLTVLGTGFSVDRTDTTPDRDSLSDVVILHLERLRETRERAQRALAERFRLLVARQAQQRDA
jgi:hypothetical protein